MVRLAVSVRGVCGKNTLAQVPYFLCITTGTSADWKMGHYFISYSAEVDGTILKSVDSCDYFVFIHSISRINSKQGEEDQHYVWEANADVSGADQRWLWTKSG